MAEIKDIAVIATKWATVTPQRTADYEAGIRNPRRDWARGALAAADNYKTAVIKAANDGRYSAGVTRAGTPKWQENSLSKGTQRWGPGVTLGETAYREGFAPFREAIARVTLPPRFPRGDARNLERTRVIAEALSKLKQSQGK